ncbi:alpha-L-iduronidase [Anopheles ziemanni]|uniref:alpha-L-iduronidase n=1 Tax=Anopheles ziemanni TaxID=345580 RepID=UPI00265FE99D|nr:alpha-L-iduronidase [Anopheles ziemanni]
MAAILLLLAAIASAFAEVIFMPTASSTSYQIETFPLTPFWASTGLCPPEPRNSSGMFLLSRDSLLNLELIASLTKNGAKSVRIHWLLELLQVSLEEGKFRYNFTELDSFLDSLKYFGLSPGFELMGVPVGELSMQITHSEYFWKDLVQQLVEHYLNRYGASYVALWRFEAWNEPDLKTYNMLNFSVNDYLTYVTAIRMGLDAMIDSAGPGVVRLGLNGPAGLFKAEVHHPFCWGVLDFCNSMPNQCPFDIITFHRKGSGRWASEVLDGARELINDIFTRFPKLRRMKFANDEADPIASWSTGRPFQADVRYAAMLFSIVSQHWNAMLDTGDDFGQHFLFLSNDNAFLSYYPYVFEQRTLLARFQMNETVPPHTQFVVKPIYSALGMLGRLGERATRTYFQKGNVSYIISFDDRSPPSYLCIVASRSNDTFPLIVRRSWFNITLPLSVFGRTRVSYLIEALQDGLNDPFRIWQWEGRPAYPSAKQLAAMRAVQFPSVLNRGGVAEPVQFDQYSDSTTLSVNLSLSGPWILSVRICSSLSANNKLFGPVRRLRVRSVFADNVLIFWAVPNRGNVRCIQKYEVWFRPLQSAVGKEKCKWRAINNHQHTPFTFFQYVTDSALTCSGVSGYYKVRVIDMFNRPAPFSSVIRYEAHQGETI